MENNEKSYSPKFIETTIAEPIWVKNEPHINDDGIWIPAQTHTLLGSSPIYNLLIPKDLFIEAYNKWIKGEE